jgi:hypothetical protein
VFRNGVVLPVDATFSERTALAILGNRIRAYLYSEQPGWDDAGAEPGDGDELMRIAGWKIVTDGSNQGFTGRQRAPYHTGDTVGIFYVEPEALREGGRPCTQGLAALHARERQCGDRQHPGCRRGSS